MKVLHVGKYFPPFFGGIEKVNFNIVEWLNKNGIRTDELCFNQINKTVIEERSTYRVTKASKLLTIFSTPISLSFFFLLKKNLKSYDIVHVHLPNPLATVALIFFNFNGKLIIHWHSDIVKQKILRFLFSPFETMLLSKSDYIIATSSPYLKGSRILRRFEEKCLIVPIGIDSNDFVDNQDLREQLKTDYFGKQVVFSIGRLIYYKGFEYLIKAAKYLPDNIIILIAGEGRLESRLRNLIEELNLNEKVKLIGKLAFDEIAEYYKRCDLFCLPSVEKSEAFGVVQLEAMLHGKAIVSTNIPFSGVPWVNKDNYSGKVVPPANPNALANAITEILRDEKQLKTYGENSRKRYEELFTSEKMGRNIYNIYESLWDRS